MSKENITEKFIAQIVNIVQKGFSEKDLFQARKCLLDYIGVTVAGSKQDCPISNELVEGNPGKYIVIGMNHTADLNATVLVNAYNSHVLELDDGHRIGMMHLAAPIFSGLLTVAEKNNCKLNELLCGAIAGYEAAIRLASAIQPNHKLKGFHATGTCGTIGCAIGIGVMLGYTQKELGNVLSAAATSGAGLLEVITGESMQKPYNISNAAISGVNAAIFGKGFAGPKDVLCGERGFINNFTDKYNIDVLLENRQELAIHSIYMKPYAACRHCHSPIEAALKIRSQREMSETDIKNIMVETYELAVKGHEHNMIEGINSAKMSIPYSVAVALLFNNAGMDVYTIDTINNEDVHKLTQKIQVTENDEYSNEFPQKRVSTVTINWNNGESTTTRVDYPKGEPENPMDGIELFDKFSSLMKVAGISLETTKEIKTYVMGKADVPIRVLMDMLQG